MVIIDPERWMVTHSRTESTTRGEMPMPAERTVTGIVATELVGR